MQNNKPFQSPTPGEFLELCLNDDKLMSALKDAREAEEAWDAYQDRLANITFCKICNNPKESTDCPVCTALKS